MVWMTRKSSLADDLKSALRRWRPFDPGERDGLRDPGERWLSRDQLKLIIIGSNEVAGIIRQELRQIGVVSRCVPDKLAMVAHDEYATKWPKLVQHQGIYIRHKLVWENLFFVQPTKHVLSRSPEWWFLADSLGATHIFSGCFSTTLGRTSTASRNAADNCLRTLRQRLQPPDLLKRANIALPSSGEGLQHRDFIQRSLTTSKNSSPENKQQYHTVLLQRGRNPAATSSWRHRALIFIDAKHNEHLRRCLCHGYPLNNSSTHQLVHVPHQGVEFPSLDGISGSWGTGNR
ncbi:hypothetical protein BJ878DRAFT_481024 [Calycina marina]|uniref:Uncharacterized protein n=1 Tax=Calycina marina TaxID=1763456 RepID=A0A9P7Z1T7_9HELO|nr:hypothetical protein BJ878DRAFT_481024 [Calycina marina]